MRDTYKSGIYEIAIGSIEEPGGKFCGHVLVREARGQTANPETHVCEDVDPSIEFARQRAAAWALLHYPPTAP